MWVVLFTVALSRDIIPQPDGCKRYETEIERLQKVPVLLQTSEEPRRDEDEEHRYDDGQADSMYGGQHRLRHGPSAVEVGHRASSHQDHNPLHRNGEEEEGDRDAEEGVDNAEGLPSV